MKRLAKTSLPPQGSRVPVKPLNAPLSLANTVRPLAPSPQQSHVAGSSPSASRLDGEASSLPSPSRFAHDFSTIPVSRPVSPQTNAGISGHPSLPPIHRFSPQPVKVQRQIKKEEEEGTVQTKEAPDHTPTITPEQQTYIHSLDTGGDSLPASTRAFMESRFRHDFSHVRVHTGDNADRSVRSVNALAYTVGRNIVFANGQFAPRTPVGTQLLAHELTHVMQQPPSTNFRSVLAVAPHNSVAETHARANASAIMSSSPMSAPHQLSPAPTISRATPDEVTSTPTNQPAASGTKGPQGPSPLARIHKLLSRSIFDWAVTDNDARQALEILRSLRPAELFETARIMKFSGDWKTLREELPASDRLALNYFDGIVLNPNSGYIMPGDTLKIELFSGSKVEEKVPEEYIVTGAGVTLPFLAKPVQVAELLPQDAARTIAQTYVNSELYWSITVHVTPVRRGSKYAGFGNVTAPMTFDSNVSISPQSPEGKHYAKFSHFVNYIKTIKATDAFTSNALTYYYSQLDKNLDAYKTPEDLWKWALSQASKPPPSTPLQPFLELARMMTERLSIAPPQEQARLQAALSRYTSWLNAHLNDPNLAKNDPVHIWSRAYLNAITAEVQAEVQASVAKARQEREQHLEEQNWKKAVAKFDDALKLMMTKVWAVAPPKLIQKSKEELSAEGELVKISYLVQPSDAERIIRDKIASDFMNTIVSHMSDPGFADKSATADFVDWLNQNPEKLKALQLTIAHPTVEKFADKVDIPAWQTATEVVISLIPIVGNAIAAGEVISGEDLFGHPLTTTQRTITAVAILLPFAGKVFKLGKAAVTVSTLARDYRMSEPEARAAFRMLAEIAPGTRGARLLGEAASDIKVGKALDDPRKLKELEGLLRDMGMTDKETAKVFARPGSTMAGVEQQVGQVAKEEIKALGSITSETEEMLVKNEALRKALLKNSLAAQALKKCASPCFPPGATAEQIERLERFLERIKKTGTYDEEALRKYLANRRVDLDAALNDIINGTDNTTRLNQLLEFFNSDGKVTRGISPEVIAARKALAADIGVTYGRIQAGNEGLVSAHFVNPFEHIGSHGQGFDDIMLRGKDIERDIVYIIEYKGGEARLASGQMEQQWVIDNIRRLYREGGPTGQEWARKLAKALEEGRLRGRGYSTPVDKGAASVTEVLNDGKDWIYGKVKVLLGP